jgi:hypothetical protein
MSLKSCGVPIQADHISTFNSRCHDVEADGRTSVANQGLQLALEFTTDTADDLAEMDRVTCIWDAGRGLENAREDVARAP